MFPLMVGSLLGEMDFGLDLELMIKCCRRCDVTINTIDGWIEIILCADVAQRMFMLMIWA